MFVFSESNDFKMNVWFRTKIEFHMTMPVKGWPSLDCLCGILLIVRILMGGGLPTLPPLGPGMGGGIMGLAKSEEIIKNT